MHGEFIQIYKGYDLEFGNTQGIWIVLCVSFFFSFFSKCENTISRQFKTVFHENLNDHNHYRDMHMCRVGEIFGNILKHREESRVVSLYQQDMLPRGHCWGYTVLVPCHVVKSLQPIWRLGTCSFHLGVPDLQLICSDLIKRRGTRTVAPVQQSGWHMP